MLGFCSVRILIGVHTLGVIAGNTETVPRFFTLWVVV